MARRTRGRTKGRVSLAASISPETTVACLAHLLSSLLVPPGPIVRPRVLRAIVLQLVQMIDRRYHADPINIWESNAPANPIWRSDRSLQRSRTQIRSQGAGQPRQGLAVRLQHRGRDIAPRSGCGWRTGAHTPDRSTWVALRASCRLPPGHRGCPHGGSAAAREYGGRLPDFTSGQRCDPVPPGMGLSHDAEAEVRNLSRFRAARLFQVDRP